MPLALVTGPVSNPVTVWHEPRSPAPGPVGTSDFVPVTVPVAESIVNVSGLTSSPSAFIRNRTDPDAGSPVQVPNQRPSRSDSVMESQTSVIGAVKRRS